MKVFKKVVAIVIWFITIPLQWVLGILAGLCLPIATLCATIEQINEPAPFSQTDAPFFVEAEEEKELDE